jgi:hypothetical protein
VPSASSLLAAEPGTHFWINRKLYFSYLWNYRYSRIKKLALRLSSRPPVHRRRCSLPHPAALLSNWVHGFKIRTIGVAPQTTLQLFYQASKCQQKKAVIAHAPLRPPRRLSPLLLCRRVERTRSPVSSGSPSPLTSTIKDPRECFINPQCFDQCCVSSVGLQCTCRRKRTTPSDPYYSSQIRMYLSLECV